MRKVFLLFVSAVFLSCGASKTQPENAMPAEQKTPDAIVFLSFKMVRNPNGKNSVTLINQNIASGKIKKGSEMRADSENLLAFEVYQNNRLSQTILINHPLYKHVEYLDDDNHYKSKDIVSDQEEFFIRIQTNGEAATIKILENLKEKTPSELLTFKM